MDKKALIVHVLTQLQPYRKDASDILVIVQNEILPDHLLDMLLSSINDAVKRVTDKKLQSELQEKLDYVEKLHQQEVLDRQQDVSDADALLEQLDE